MKMTHSFFCKNQGQRSGGSKVKVESNGRRTDKRTDMIDFITFLTNAIGNKCLLSDIKFANASRSLIGHRAFVYCREYCAVI